MDGQETSGCSCTLKCNSTLTKCSCSSIGKIASISLQIQINNSQPKKRDTSLVPIHHHQLKASSVTKSVRLNTKFYCPFTDVSKLCRDGTHFATLPSVSLFTRQRPTLTASHLRLRKAISVTCPYSSDFNPKLHRERHGMLA